MQIEAITLLLTTTKLFRKRHRSGVGRILSCGNLVPGLLSLKNGTVGKEIKSPGEEVDLVRLLGLYFL